MTTLLIEYLRPNGEPLRLADLGFQYIESMGLPLTHAERPMRVEVEPKTSKAGNVYFEYEHKSIPLPDGLNTVLCVEGTTVSMKAERLSGAGNPTREGKAFVTVNGIDYEVTVFLTKGKRPYWVKVHAQKAGKHQRAAAGPLTGGRIV